MADQKFTDLPAGSAPFDDGSLIAIADFDGISTYASEKITLAQAKTLFSGYSIDTVYSASGGSSSPVTIPETISVPNNSTVSFEVFVTAVKNQSSFGGAGSSYQRISGSIQNISGTTSLSSANVVSTIAEAGGFAGLVVEAVANDASDTLDFVVNQATGYTIEWRIQVRTSVSSY